MLQSGCEPGPRCSRCSSDRPLRQPGGCAPPGDQRDSTMGVLGSERLGANLRVRFCLGVEDRGEVALALGLGTRRAGRPSCWTPPASSICVSAAKASTVPGPPAGAGCHRPGPPARRPPRPQPGRAGRRVRPGGRQPPARPAPPGRHPAAQVRRRRPRRPGPARSGRLGGGRGGRRRPGAGPAAGRARQRRPSRRHRQRPGVATGRQKTWVYDRLADLQQTGRVGRAGQGRYRLTRYPEPGWDARS
jgi:hypothetical protein